MRQKPAMTAQSTAPEPGAVERLLRRDQLIVACAAGLLVLLAGLYTVFGVGMDMTAVEMTQMARPIGDPMAMPMTPVWTVGYALLVFLMWWIMMIAMMTPSAAPMLLLYTALKRMGPESSRAVLYSALFLSGYLIAWAVFSALAAGLQWGLESIDLVSGSMMALKSRWFAGAVLLAAGLYQFSPLKHSCLTQCRSPAQFLAEHRHPGLFGAVRMGADHGLYCLGCCWALMALLFVGGIMNLYWIVGLTLFVLVEKLSPRGIYLARAGGALLMLAGLYFLAAGLTGF